MSKARAARMKRVKAATETVEDELNRLTEDERQEPFDGWERKDAFHEVIRHLKRRWAELSQDAPETRENAPGRPKAWL